MDSKHGHLWAVVFDNSTQAFHVRDQLAELGWGSGQAGRYLILVDLAVVVRKEDGTFALEHEPFHNVGNIVACSLVGFLAGLVVAAPLTGAAAGALVGGAGSAVTAHSGIPAEFIHEVEHLMKPGTSALFVLDEAGDLNIILHTIQGLGGTVVKTNVDLERVKLIQSTLGSATSSSPQESRPRKET